MASEVSNPRDVHANLFWRRMAAWGSRRAEWWVRWSPPFFGVAAAVAVPRARRAVVHHLRQVRGPVSPLREVRDVCSTFATYASCLAETLSNEAARGPRAARALVCGDRHIRPLLGTGGVILATGHTAGWESVGPLLVRDYGMRIQLVMQPEADAGARRLQDRARERAGVEIVHLGDPLASIGLLRHLQGGGAVALQLDRAPPEVRGRPVRFLDTPAVLPEGPLRLAALSGAPIVPVFCARTGHRTYRVEVHPPRSLPRRPSDAELDATAQYLADCMTRFLRAHPTQWLNFS